MRHLTAAGLSPQRTVQLDRGYWQAPAQQCPQHEPDATLALGALVSRELGWHTLPILRLPANQQAHFPDGVRVSVSENGELDTR